MPGPGFNEADLQQMQELGITELQVHQQIAHFLKPSVFIKLNRPCTLGDGIVAIGSPEKEKYLQLQAQAAAAGRFCKFVPASSS